MNGDIDAISQDRALCELLRQRGKLDRAGFDRVWRWHRENGQRVNMIATSLGLVSEHDMAVVLSEFLSLPLLGPSDYPLEIPFEEKIDTAFLKDARMLPLAETDEGVLLAMADPRDDFGRRAIEFKYGKTVLPRVAVPSELEAAIDQLHGKQKSSLAEIVETIGGDEYDLNDDAELLRNLASEAPVIRLVNLIISKAVEARASDIHIEPFENQLRVRYRVDGVLHEIESPPNRLRHAVISRIKIMARLNIAERRLPQDGRIKLVVRGKEIDLRVSTVPAMHGESAVLRILDKSAGVMSFEKLGFDGDSLQTFLEMLHQPNGIVLVTGPTGSGKTTTLYAALLALNTPDKKILTVEDPIEYQLFGVNQIQVKPQIGLDFASVLRAFLRQDPDIIMIGEIRDLETAQIAVQASLTGHLVLSTLHTNSAAATITRLIDMGVDDFMLTSTLSGVVAQRLVRTLCPHCREPYAVLPEIASQLKLHPLTDEPDITLYRPKGCRQCGGTGYYGRISIAEVLPIDDRIRTLIMRHAEARPIHEQAVKNGMRTIYEDGLRKALNGQTTVEEVMRATREA
jgi:general secretion pathway protein E